MISGRIWKCDIRVRSRLEVVTLSATIVHRPPPPWYRHTHSPTCHPLPPLLQRYANTVSYDRARAAVEEFSTGGAAASVVSEVAGAAAGAGKKRSPSAVAAVGSRGSGANKGGGTAAKVDPPGCAALQQLLLGNIPKGVDGLDWVCMGNFKPIIAGWAYLSTQRNIHTSTLLHSMRPLRDHTGCTSALSPPRPTFHTSTHIHTCTSSQGQPLRRSRPSRPSGSGAQLAGRALSKSPCPAVYPHFHISTHTFTLFLRDHAGGALGPVSHLAPEPGGPGEGLGGTQSHRCSRSWGRE